jgi:hypothetical protein
MMVKRDPHFDECNGEGRATVVTPLYK